MWVCEYVSMCVCSCFLSLHCRFCENLIMAKLTSTTTSQCWAQLNWHPPSMHITLNLTHSGPQNTHIHTPSSTFSAFQLLVLAFSIISISSVFDNATLIIIAWWWGRHSTFMQTKASDWLLGELIINYSSLVIECPLFTFFYSHMTYLFHHVIAITWLPSRGMLDLTSSEWLK